MINNERHKKKQMSIVSYLAPLINKNKKIKLFKSHNKKFKDGHQKRDFVHVYDIVDGLIKIALTDINHTDAWELGTGINYSINELFKYFKDKFDVKSINIPDQPGNYRQTLRENDDSLKLLDWKPMDRLKDHINSFN